MAEIIKTRRLKIVSIIFIAIIIFGFLTFRIPAYNYNLTVGQTNEELSQPDYMISLSQALEILKSNSQNYLFIDVRSPEEFSTNHVENSINIPSWEMLEEQNYSLLRKLDSDNYILVFYGNDPVQANGSWILLKQLGIKNGKLLTADFNWISKADSGSVRHIPIEKLIFSDSAIMVLSNHGSDEGLSVDVTPEKIVPVKKVKKTATAGGC
jgi:rhodanese-related sulfurtransferase